MLIMKKMISFFIDMIPPTITAQEKKIHVVRGKPIMYDTSELNVAKSKLLGYLSHHVPDQMFNSSIRLIVWWCFPITGKHHDGEYKYTKPDTDNLNKALKDCMTALHFWKDDALVVSEVIEKYWAKRPGIYIKIEEVKN